MNFRSASRTLLATAAVVAFSAGCGSVQEALSYKPHETRGLQYLEKGDFAQAEEQLKLAASLAASGQENRAGNVGRLEYELGTMYRKQGKNADAEEGYRRALVVFSETPKLVNDSDRRYWAQCLSDYAVLLREIGRPDEAQVRERQARQMLASLGQSGATAPSGAPTQSAPPSPPAPPATPSQPAQSSPPAATGTP